MRCDHSDDGFQQFSFANSIATTKGGTHVSHVTEQVLFSLARHHREQSPCERRSAAGLGFGLEPRAALELWGTKGVARYEVMRALGAVGAPFRAHSVEGARVF